MFKWDRQQACHIFASGLSLGKHPTSATVWRVSPYMRTATMPHWINLSCFHCLFEAKSVQCWCVLKCDASTQIVSGWDLWAIAGLLHWYIRCLFAIADHRRLLSLLNACGVAARGTLVYLALNNFSSRHIQLRFISLPYKMLIKKIQMTLKQTRVDWSTEISNEASDVAYFKMLLFCPALK